eukprot:7077356-Pyramimonas_sp.AAC.1
MRARSASYCSLHSGRDVTIQGGGPYSHMPIESPPGPYRGLRCGPRKGVFRAGLLGSIEDRWITDPAV